MPHPRMKSLVYMCDMCDITHAVDGQETWLKRWQVSHEAPSFVRHDTPHLLVWHDTPLHERDMTETLTSEPRGTFVRETWHTTFISMTWHTTSWARHDTPETWQNQLTSEPVDNIIATMRISDVIATISIFDYTFSFSPTEPRQTREIRDWDHNSWAVVIIECTISLVRGETRQNWGMTWHDWMRLADAGAHGAAARR